MDLTRLTVRELAAALASSRIAPEEVLEAQAARIARMNLRLGALTEFHPEDVRNRWQTTVPNAARGRLWGVPVGVKDNICIAGELTTCGSRILQGFRPPYDATVVGRLKAAGAVVVGRLNMDEFAFGSSTETSCYGAVKNPWDTTRVPGGSSGGSAAAVAADLLWAALGSDTGGSIRQPAAFCGVVGLKPTYGRVSRYGLVAFASSLDQIGPITKDVTDAAILLDLIAGHDPRDSTTVNEATPSFTTGLTGPLRGMRLGIPREYFVDGLAPEVAQAVREARRVFERLGVVCEEVSLPHTPYAVATYYIIATAEASSNLARYDGVQYGLRLPADPAHSSLLEMYETTRGHGFGAEAKRRIMLGTYVLSRGYYDAYYLTALKVRQLIRQDFEAVFQRCEAILTPTTPTVAFRLGEKIHDPLTMYLSDIYTIPANLAGVPAISLPCGFTAAGLPIGLQLTGPVLREDLLLRLAYGYEQATPWHTRKPSLN